MQTFQRLQLLKQQAGQKRQGSTLDRQPGGEQISDLQARLFKLRLSSTNSSNDSVREKQCGALPGQEIAQGLRCIASDFSLPEDLGHFARWQRNLLDTKPTEIAFVDIETTGLSSGAGNLAFLVGIGRITGTKAAIKQYLLSSPSGEAAMLDALDDDLRNMSAWVSFNGKSFDIPVLQTRYRMQRRKPPELTHHLDLLHCFRRLYKSRWDNFRLATAEQQLLGIFRSNDLPSAEVPAAYQSFLRCGATEKLLLAIEHHRQDIASLVSLLHKLGEIVARPHLHDACLDAYVAEWFKTGRYDLLSQLGSDQTASLGTQGLVAWGQFQQHLGRLREAEKKYLRAALNDDEKALKRLAIFYEHTLKNADSALHASQRLLKRCPHCEDTRSRIARLQDKQRAKRLEF